MIMIMIMITLGATRSDSAQADGSAKGGA